MPEVQRYALFLALVVAVASYIALFSVERAVSVFAEVDNSELQLRDVVRSSTHFLSGYVMVRSMCDFLIVRSVSIDETHYHLILRTWRGPYLDCQENSTSRYFRTVVFGPPNAQFTAELDGKPMDTLILPAKQMLQ